MANVRLDQNGIPKGPVFETTPPLVHRSGVTAVDAEDPADISGAVDCAGYEQCRFDITISGTDFASLEVQAIFWNSRQSKWFGGAKRELTKTGQHALVVEVRGAVVFLKVTAFSGTSFSLSADYALS
ncbi:MAG TPA: hypothetical protein G4O03_03660 [Dehalococcoidia bacterium]|nr:hypothetical protein [Dehalococcoidia bacterium]